MKDLLDSKVKVLFGLEQQGHIPTIEDSLKRWNPRIFSDDNMFQVWEDIAKKIGWLGFAVCQDYIRHLKRKNKNSIPISKLEELMANCNDKNNIFALEDDLQALIDETKK